DAQRETAGGADDALHLPAPEHVSDRAAAGQERLARSERQLVAETDGGTVALVVARVPLVGVQIPGVCRVVRLDLARSIVGALRELVVSEEEQSIRVALFEAERHAVEVRPSRVRGIQNRRLKR